MKSENDWGWYGLFEPEYLELKHVTKSLCIYGYYVNTSNNITFI